MTMTTQTTTSPNARDRRLLLEIEKLTNGGDPSIDSPEAHVSVLTVGIEGLGNRIRATPPIDRDAIARIIDDEVWNGDGDYPLERTRIATRRASAYDRADRIIALIQEG